MSGRRLDAGGRIDRSRPIRFTFDGREYEGFEGDTLASALLANGVDVVCRSPILGRPRGIVSAGVEEPSAFVEVAGPWFEPVVAATMVNLVDGLVASGRPGVGRLPATPHRTRPSVTRNRHVETLIVGSGGKGLEVARAAAERGERVLLVEREPYLAGSGLDRGPEGVELLVDATALGVYDDGYVTVVHQRDATHDTLWHVRADRVVLATGAFERPIAFADNDRPGVMLNAAVGPLHPRLRRAPGSADRGVRRERDRDGDARPPAGRRRDRRDRGCPRGMGRRRHRGRHARRGRPSGRTRRPTAHRRGRPRRRRRAAGTRRSSSIARSAAASATTTNSRRSFPTDRVRRGSRWSARPPATCRRASRTGTRRPRTLSRHFVDLQRDQTVADVARGGRRRPAQRRAREARDVHRHRDRPGSDERHDDRRDRERRARMGARRAGADERAPAVRPGVVRTRSPGSIAVPSCSTPSGARRCTRRTSNEGRSSRTSASGNGRATSREPDEDMHAAVARECLAVRNGVGILDASTLGKIEVVGPDAPAFLDRMYTNRDVEPRRRVDPLRPDARARRDGVRRRRRDAPGGGSVPGDHDDRRRGRRPRPVRGMAPDRMAGAPRVLHERDRAVGGDRRRRPEGARRARRGGHRTWICWTTRSRS